MWKSVCRNIETRSASRREREQLTINKRQLFCQGRRGVKVIPLDFLNTLAVSLSSDVTTTPSTLQYLNIITGEHRVRVAVLVLYQITVKQAIQCLF